MVTDSVGVPSLSGETVTNQVKLLNVQVLRAYAAFAVVVFHTGFVWVRHKELGRFGVDTFFVISGFMMAYICATNSKNFFLRRVARIVPLYWLATSAVFAVAWVSPSLVKATSRSWIELAKSLIFIPFVKSDGLVQPTLFLGWSINDEMFFYAVIAIALLISRRYAAVLSFVMVLGIFVGLWLAQSPAAAAISYSRFDILGFLLGIICFWIFNSVPVEFSFRFRYLIAVIAGLAIMAQICLAIFQFPATGRGARGYEVGTISWLLIQIGVLLAPTVMVLCAVLLDRAGFSIKWSLLILLGDASYATYLVHIYILVVFGHVAGRFSFHLLTTAVPGMLLSVVVAHAIGVLVYLYFDKPAHTWFRQKLERNRFSNRASNRLDRVMR